MAADFSRRAENCVSIRRQLKIVVDSK